jgi:hypothetical protein
MEGRGYDHDKQGEMLMDLLCIDWNQVLDWVTAIVSAGLQIATIILAYRVYKLMDFNKKWKLAWFIWLFGMIVLLSRRATAIVLALGVNGDIVRALLWTDYHITIVIMSATWFLFVLLKYSLFKEFFTTKTKQKNFPKSKNYPSWRKNKSKK